MPELDGWPYKPLPSAFDERQGHMRYVVQRTEDGYYGWAWRGQITIADMIGPCLTLYACQRRLLEALTGGGEGV